MILIDPRAGSQNYIQPLRNLGASVEIAMLEFGDAAFVGKLTGMIGVELKTVNDVLACIDSGRFAGHQLPGLVAHYDAAYLIVEGLWRPGPQDGTLETHRGRDWSPVKIGARFRQYRELDHWLTTMEVCGRIRVRRTSTPHETARTLFDLADWYAREDEHKSHLAFDRSTELALQAQVTKEQRRSGGARFFYEKPSPKRQFAALWPKVGVEKSAAVADAFPNVRAMANATDEELMQIPGVGKGIVKQVRSFLEDA